MAKRLLPFLVIFMACIMAACEHDTLYTNTDARLVFSADTISFDTVFNTIGSATKRFKVYNKYSQPIRIRSIKLSGNKYFKVNIDGHVGSEISNLDIEANDSAFVFVQVNIDPQNANAPILVSDSIQFILNSNVQYLQLTAWGQDVHLLRRDTLKVSQTWTNDKPYVIYDYALVDSGTVLTIEAGTTVYHHRQAWLVVDGTLKVNGTISNPVTFRGDRLDKINYAPALPYDKIPGQWGNIWIRPASTGNIFNYAHIKNAELGLWLGELGSDKAQPSVELNGCTIENSSFSGIFAINAKVKAYNCVFANAGYSNFVCITGGAYEFYQCTFANYYEFESSGSFGIILQNVAKDENDSLHYGNLTKAYFGNCLIFGEAKEQVLLRSVPTYAMDYMFDHCVIKGSIYYLPDETKRPRTKLDSVKTNPGFKTLDRENYVYDFRLTKTSIAREVGSSETGNAYPFDITGKPRMEFDTDVPDAGAYEYVPEK